jgi:hypothetical protein
MLEPCDVEDHFESDRAVLAYIEQEEQDNAVDSTG